MKKEKRILVDFTISILHHGHIRLLKKASKRGKVIVALATDSTVLKHKGFLPELNYKQRKEILNSIKYVDEIFPSEWIITDKYLKKHKIDFLLHGEDNFNQVEKNKLIIVKRTKKISSKNLRKKAHKNYIKLLNKN